MPRAGTAGNRHYTTGSINQDIITGGITTYLFEILILVYYNVYSARVASDLCLAVVRSALIRSRQSLSDRTAAVVARLNTHTHTRTHIHIYIFVYLFIRMIYPTTR